VAGAFGVILVKSVLLTKHGLTLAEPVIVGTGTGCRFLVGCWFRGSTTGGHDPFPQDIVVLRKHRLGASS